jgi:hypothetical protein
MSTLAVPATEVNALPAFNPEAIGKRAVARARRIARRHGLRIVTEHCVDGGCLYGLETIALLSCGLPLTIIGGDDYYSLNELMAFCHGLAEAAVLVCSQCGAEVQR